MVNPSCGTFCESLTSFISSNSKGVYLLLAVQCPNVSLFGRDTFFNKGVEESCWYSLSSKTAPWEWL